MLRTMAMSLTLALLSAGLFSSAIGQTSWTISDTLDSEGNYNATRWVDIEANSIEFEVTVRTAGFVGFGLSYTGDMVGADIVIGGVDSENKPYFTDRHAVAQAEPLVDASQDWTLIEATEELGITTLRFNRTLVTCDDDDVPITEDTLKIIWAYGPTDDIAYHGGNKGVQSVNLLDPPQPSPDMTGIEEWSVLIDDVMPAQKTSYWCSIHTTPPEMTSKTYLVGFEAQIEGKQAETHTHHFIYSKCQPNDQAAIDILESRLNQPGQDCETSGPDSPRQFCELYMFVWAKGGGRTMFPDTVGFPILESGEKEYYMLEIHYDNPNATADIQFETGLTIFYDQERTVEAGLLVVGHNVWWPHTIPPNSVNFMTSGHCPGECTQWAFPEEGINVFNILLHAHLSGRRLKIRHFRGAEELAWVSTDDNYDFNYQQNRPLKKELIVLPGDHLVYECVTDTTWKDGLLTIGDLATTDEMCETFLFYYPRVEMFNCLSTVNENTTMALLGIHNITENPADNNNPIITAPASMGNLSYVDALETVVEWTDTLRAEFQETVRYSEHFYTCVKMNGTGYDAITGTVRYPTIEEIYEPVDVCSLGAGGDETTTPAGASTLNLSNLLFGILTTLVGLSVLRM